MFFLIVCNPIDSIQCRSLYQSGIFCMETFAHNNLRLGCKFCYNQSRMSKTVLYIDSHNHPTCTEKHNGVLRFASMADWNVIRKITSTKPNDILKLLKTTEPDGCIINATRFLDQLPPSLFKGIPIVYLDTNPDIFGEDICMVSHDSFGTGVLAAKKLLSLQLKHYFYLPYKTETFWCDQRWLGFSKTIAEAGFTAKKLNRAAPIRKTLPPADSGIMTANDETAEILLSQLKTHGCRIPNKIALISADDSKIARANGITSIRIDFEQGGYSAAKMLSAFIDREGHPQKKTFGDICVQHRNSTRHFSQMLPCIPDAISFIRENACSGITVADVVDFLDAPRRTVEEHFRKSTGHSILQEIQSVRLERVFAMLTSTKKPIATIVDTCGYRTPQALRKAFRLHAGISMHDWRRREYSVK